MVLATVFFSNCFTWLKALLLFCIVLLRERDGRLLCLSKNIAFEFVLDDFFIAISFSKSFIWILFGEVSSRTFSCVFENSSKESSENNRSYYFNSTISVFAKDSTFYSISIQLFFLSRFSHFLSIRLSEETVDKKNIESTM